MLIDSTKRKLQVPPKFLPYMEKHRIYELFHELACELVIQRPDDHVLFMKKVLTHAAMTRNARRIIIIAPPFIDKTVIAMQLAATLNIPVISEKQIAKSLKKQENKKWRPEYLLAKVIRKKMQKTHDDCNAGWILIDYPRTPEEACVFRRIGILPTHVFQLIPAFVSPSQPMHGKTIPAEWNAYRANLCGIREAFRGRWQEIVMNNRSAQKIVEVCSHFLLNNKHCGAPMLPRICLIGSPGSGRTTVAAQLAKRFGLIHVNFNALLDEVLARDCSESKRLKVVGVKQEVKTEVYADIVEKKLLDSYCVNKGWVLTGYPMLLQDLRNLDMMPTPPNRVIFLECPMDICRYRLVNRKMNVYTGSVTNVANFPTYEKTRLLKTHPDDLPENVTKMLNQYENVYADLKNYCGGTAYSVDAGQIIQMVVELTESWIMKPAPDCPPRDPRCLYEKTICVCKAASCVYKHNHKDIA